MSIEFARLRAPIRTGPIIANCARAECIPVTAIPGMPRGQKYPKPFNGYEIKLPPANTETTKNPRDAQEAARHKRLETTERYMHTRRDRRWEVAHGLNR